MIKKILFILRYLRYLVSSKNKHSAHSPFLYNFIIKVLNQDSNDKNCEAISRLRKGLCQSENVIKITDFGAGSNINNSKKRKIKDIAKNSAKNKKFGELLYRIVNHYNPKNIIELGTSLGISTLYLAMGNKKSNVFTLEGCPETAKIAKNNFEKMSIKNTNITVGNFSEKLEKQLIKMKSIDLVFIDGNHQYKPTINYFEKCLKYTNNETIFIFDDIHWSKGMENAWKYIKSHQKTTLTIDLFYLGIVFIKSELSKENYTIKF